jgi:A/G-specific adenine glycosylase
VPPKTQSERGVVDPATRKIFVAKLRAWFKRHGRDLPWRRSRDGYEVLVSELMLQQTQVSRVVDYYQRFLRRFPTLTDVARARPARVMEAWDGLGYYARARNLHRLAQRLTDGGRQPATIPADPEDLQELPGVGPYTAAAVASFAYERRATPIDTNVSRVLKRVFAPRCDVRTAGGKRRLQLIAMSVLPRSGQSAWLHNQALMELGALICTARIAHCSACPIRGVCGSARGGTRRKGRGFRAAERG